MTTFFWLFRTFSGIFFWKSELNSELIFKVSKSPFCEVCIFGDFQVLISSNVLKLDGILSFLLSVCEKFLLEKEVLFGLTFFQEKCSDKITFAQWRNLFFQVEMRWATTQRTNWDINYTGGGMFFHCGLSQFFLWKNRNFGKNNKKRSK